MFAICGLNPVNSPALATIRDAYKVIIWHVFVGGGLPPTGGAGVPTWAQIDKAMDNLNTQDKIDQVFSPLEGEEWVRSRRIPVQVLGRVRPIAPPLHVGR